MLDEKLCLVFLATWLSSHPERLSNGCRQQQQNTKIASGGRGSSSRNRRGRENLTQHFGSCISCAAVRCRLSSIRKVTFECENTSPATIMTIAKGVVNGNAAPTASNGVHHIDVGVEGGGGSQDGFFTSAVSVQHKVKNKWPLSKAACCIGIFPGNVKHF
jgi:hypothetical protein